ncbi:uncharacterized protein RHOBADRAFT_55895 [Rhodotorula graminis WP1]|uniref:CRAL-TRIO domain-containing protein n=1 Tax=Rhodotorula graminis (strain WP1) TaxID=578459 RepID=A0A0N8PZI6_RHOGW|nr:uncharacterized protein RHOBADRAFT_55895 [Rhodotorula graminis WP1]KPV72429.1 hypothetical protein RHOBADRAFT_55895 [Rhodotorula graminis WP1]
MANDKLPVTKLAPVDSRQALAGHVGHLTPDQQAALDTFKDRLQQKGYFTPANGAAKASHDDVTLTRFLRARSFDVPGAFKQFTTAEDWRRNEHVDQLYDEFDVDEFQLARELYPQFTGRRDKQGLPVYVYEVGALDKKKTDAYAKDTARLEPRMIALYEHMVQFVLPFASSVPHEHPETPISGCSTIVDVSNVSLLRFWALKGHMQRASVLATARYAETLGSIYLVGAPSFFSTVWGWVKGWFDPGTVDKINILAPATQTQDLAARIPLDSIPRKYGGTLDWAYGAPGPVLDDDARRTLGAREGEDLGPLLSAPVRWVDGRLVVKGTGRSEAVLERWQDGGRAGEAAAAAASANGHAEGRAQEQEQDRAAERAQEVEQEEPVAEQAAREPEAQAASAAPSAGSSSTPSPVPASAFTAASTSSTSTAPTTSPATPRTDAALSPSAPAPEPAAPTSSSLPPPILGVGYSNAPSSTATTDSTHPTPAPAAPDGEHDIHAAAREHPAAPVKDLAAALEGTTL